MSRALYRSGQVLHALRPRLQPADLAFARQALRPPLAGLFFAMSRRDQRHALAVARRLQAQVASDPDLLTAALLHDCGKGEVPVWLRIVKVMAPGLLPSLAAERGPAWRQAAHRLLHHERLGVERLQAAGASPATLRLILGTVEPAEADRLTLLLAADDAS